MNRLIPWQLLAIHARNIIACSAKRGIISSADRRSQLCLVVRASPKLLCQRQIKTPIELFLLCFSYLYSTLIQISAEELVEALSHHSSSKASSPLIASFGGRLVDIEISNSFPLG